MASKAIDVWLYDVHVARLSEPRRFRLRLDFTEEALDTFGEGSRVLSLALPVSRQPIQDRNTALPVSAFIEGLLPEGNLRRHIASEAGVPVDDTMALLRQIGAECAGAVQFLADGAKPGAGQVRRLTKQELDRLIADLPTYHLPEGATPQASLAGVHDKVLLAALPDGAWGWPEGGAASTHIIKPEPPGGAVRHLIQTEDWALRAARRAGLRAAESRLERFDEREAIVVVRYDRSPEGHRLHQEDFCQALGLDPQAKYESTSEATRLGSRLRRVARAAAPRARDPDGFRVELLQAVTFNVVIGNGDAHSKNYSLLIGRDGSVSLAPIYDAAPVLYLDPAFKGTGHVINGKTNIDDINVDDLTAEAASWGMGVPRARAAVRSCMERVYSSVERVPLPPGAESVRPNLDQLWTRRSWPSAALKSADSGSTVDDADQ
ncbi:type II toxin-antitoxin system HipA family toxin [Mycobacterium branderi]|uniref:Iron permease n=1 Tax=Mycobacterium branderi TaxID=43348 RepID=A0A7I7W1F4_9MYCO|nr:HipA domain-containing protein [Mycobacterium branderi]MCV7235387.1 HipA domain-containing protein [Mycobacterium branderi]ORA28710.1 iron permease [Mycobacterium branderi]BBZ10960.1 putative kinase Y4mE [Mycobacterium branderi]